MTCTPLSPGAADALVFDLGRVVLDIDFSRALACWASHAGCAPSDIGRRFVRDESYRHHEIGNISDAEYFADLRASLGIRLTDEQVLEGWNAIFAGEMPDIDALLKRAGRHLPLYAFSNTNRAHVAHFSKAHGELLRHFRELFLSSTIGLRKPDAAAYDHVVNAIGVPASRIVFFDDLAANIEGAHAVGIRAVHVKSSIDIAEALSALGI
ncbi:MAG: HAD-IA family hydrolase [Bradyrhizobium sp.]|nr:HAD-IA family hydrolase [Bradyrhizobium sp.]